MARAKKQGVVDTRGDEAGDALAALIERVEAVDVQTPESRTVFIARTADKMVAVLGADMRAAPLVLQGLMALEKAVAVLGAVGAMPREQVNGLWEAGSIGETVVVPPAIVPPEPPDDETIEDVMAGREGAAE